MAWQKYPVPCECGKIHEVAAGDAGRRLACSCGKTVDVPSLVRLKASVGQSAVSADFELDQMVGTSALPVESTCGACGIRTDEKRHVVVVCERADQAGRTVATPGAVATGCLTGLLFGWVLIWRQTEAGQSRGRNVAYRLPVRVCGNCAAGRWTTELTRSILERTPLYARLLNKYPNATVSHPA